MTTAAQTLAAQTSAVLTNAAQKLFQFFQARPNMWFAGSLCLMMFALIGKLHQSSSTLTILLVALSCWMILRRGSVQAVVYYCTAAALAPLIESWAISSGAWTYPSSTGGIPLWLSPGWGIVAVCFLEIGEDLSRRFEALAAPRKTPASPLQQLAQGLPIFCTLALGAAFLWSRPEMLLTVYAACGVLALLLLRERELWMFYAVGFVLGTLGEVLAVSHGAWLYSSQLDPATWFLPSWLPFGWGAAAVCLRRFGDAATLLISAKGEPLKTRRPAYV